MKEQHIIEKSFELFQKYGIKSVTMDDLSTELGMSKKTLYQYFNDKADLVSKIVFFEFNRKSQQIEKVLNGDGNALEQLLALNKFMHKEHKNYKPGMLFDLKKYFPEVYQSFSKAKRDFMYASFIKNLIKGKEEGIYRQDLDENIIAKLHLFRNENIIENDIFTFDEITSSKFVNEIFNYHLHGIVNEQGLKILKENSKQS